MVRGINTRCLHLEELEGKTNYHNNINSLRCGNNNSNNSRNSAKKQ